MLPGGKELLMLDLENYNIFKTKENCIKKNCLPHPGMKHEKITPCIFMASIDGNNHKEQN